MKAVPGTDKLGGANALGGLGGNLGNLGGTGAKGLLGNVSMGDVNSAFNTWAWTRATGASSPACCWITSAGRETPAGQPGQHQGMGGGRVYPVEPALDARGRGPLLQSCGVPL